MAHTKQFIVRLSEADRAALRRIVTHHTLSNEAEAIRWLIRQEDRRIAAAVNPVKQSSADEVEDF